MLKAAVLGATGNAGQIFVRLLNRHPWFEVSTVAASECARALKKAVEKADQSVKTLLAVSYYANSKKVSPRPLTNGWNIL